MPDPLQVINAQNSIICTGWPKPQPLTVTSQPNDFASNQLCATIADCARWTPDCAIE